MDQHSIRREVIRRMWEAHDRLNSAHSYSFDLAGIAEYNRIGDQLRSLRGLIRDLEAAL